VNLVQAAVFGFFMFAFGFSVGFFYLKHKFESHVAGVMDFEGGDSSGENPIFDDLEEFGEEIVDGGNE